MVDAGLVIARYLDKRDGGVWAVGWQGAQGGKRSDRPRPVSAGAAARQHARTYDMKLLTLTVFVEWILVTLTRLSIRGNSLP